LSRKKGPTVVSWQKYAQIQSSSAYWCWYTGRTFSRGIIYNITLKEFGDISAPVGSRGKALIVAQKPKHFNNYVVEFLKIFAIKIQATYVIYSCEFSVGKMDDKRNLVRQINY
jgi:hypothetical protein